jgi:hypothetical protein
MTCRADQITDGAATVLCICHSQALSVMDQTHVDTSTTIEPNSTKRTTNNIFFLYQRA